MTEWYKGIGIDCGETYNGLITVEWYGNDIIFDTVEDAKAFIDEMMAEEEE